MKKSTEHHKTVAIPLHMVGGGYGGSRLIPAAGPGLWIIVRAHPLGLPGEKAPAERYIYVDVAPARGGK